MNWLNQQARQNPHKRFLNDLTFQETDQRVTELARRLSKFVKGERRVALYAHNSVATALFYLALQALEIEVLMLNTRLTQEEISQKLKTLNIRVVFSDDQTFIPFDEVLQSEIDENVKLADEYDPEHIAVIMSTSATGGEFKSVPLRWKQFYAHVRASQQRLGVTEEDNWLLVLPMYHIGGLSILMRSLYNGTGITLMEKFDEKQTLKWIEDGTVNMLSLVPTMLMRIMDRIHHHQLRMVLVSGEFIPKPLVETCLVKGIPIYKSYGMTETTSQSTTFSVLEYPQKLESVGLPLPGVTIRIDNPDEKGVGEVLIQSPMVMDGYLGKAPLEGFIHTQDIGYVDEDGFLYILDRRKNIIISGGENIYPQEIENVLYAHPAVSECAIVGMKDKKWGQVPILFIVSLLDDVGILDYLSAKIAKYKLPQKIFHLDELPKNATGKILKKNLVEKYHVD
ncbi:o-succinylbenzoate--CoA ligase [Desulfitobacterium sp.]|uniref:o-succinylbenzoate--CoA ligase n=1 Tax=Desulfitobacterium sp. TaxID=49981 RepID=UPI002B1F7278|nr:o-succinylbenzoate--CoA ligase [Desulfitobacterium sp.]MEA4902326.1 o-succinylbenzoate--CoA ligase [Desulfitobacterium sp.]